MNSCSKFLLLALSIQVFFLVDIHSEILCESTDVLAPVSNKLLFKLNAGTQVDCSPEINGWIKIGIYVKIDKEQFERKQVLPGFILINIEGNEVGKVKDTTSFKIAFYDIKKDRTATNFVAYLVGEIKSFSIQKESSPEYNLKEISDSIKKINLENLREQIIKFKYTKIQSQNPDFGLIEDYILMNPTIVDMGTSSRIRLVFLNGNLAGIVQTAPVIYKNFETRKNINDVGGIFYITVTYKFESLSEETKFIDYCKSPVKY